MEILRIAANVSTPIGLLGLVVAVGYLVYALRIKSEKTKLQNLPPDKRAVAVDEYLTRYGIDGKHLPNADKLALIREEMEKRHRRSILYVVAAAIAFVFCFAITVIPAPIPKTCENSGIALQVAEGTIRIINTDKPFRVKIPASGTATIDTKCIFLWLAVEVGDTIWPRKEGHLNVHPDNTWTETIVEQGQAKQVGVSLWAANGAADGQLSRYLSSGRIAFSYSDLMQLGMKRLDVVPVVNVERE
jgi:hypothetical protein